MRKLLSLVVAVVLGMGTLFANPVDVNTAKALGQKFVQARFELTKSADLQLHYTVTSDNGQPCAYVFNIGDEGFVIVAASDNVRPILGYSDQGSFDADNLNNGAMYMLYTYKNSISYAIEKNIKATPEIAGEWESLRNYGWLNNKKPSTVGPLLTTKWDQNNPYNLYAPACVIQGSGGRCYAGCVATAMGQIMKYWNHPIQGEGSNTYDCYGYTHPTHPEWPQHYFYGTLTANFGETTYQWDLMPNSLNNATQEQIEAVALLLYHCGVAMNMTFDFDGSGTQSSDVPAAMEAYFDYDHCVQKQQIYYSLSNWIELLKAEFKQNRPVYYSGYDASVEPPAGHAFVCDGYDENDLMHFNFGWSGSNNGFYAVNAIDYASGASAIFDYVPTYVYNNTLQAPTNVSATRTSDVAQEATIAWTNPIQTMSNETVSYINQIVVTRNDDIIYVVDNPVPGEDMSFIDTTVPCYSTFDYRVYAIKDGAIGASGKASESFGPTCPWTIVATTTNMTGWKGGSIVAYDATGHEIDRFTMTNSTPTTYTMNVNVGKVVFAWVSATDNVQITFKIKDTNGNVISEYSGTTNNLQAGVLCEVNNGCGNAAPTDAPSDLNAIVYGNDIILSWQGIAQPNYGYNIYRDGVLFALTQLNGYVDQSPTLGGHCYTVCALTDGGESAMTNEACGSAGTDCDAAYYAWYYLQSNGKPTITWYIPQNSDGLTAFFIYRKMNADGEYERIKIVAPDKTEYKETRTLENGNWYYYRVVAYYQDIDCYSAPAKSAYSNEYYVKVYYDNEHLGVDEDMTQAVEVYPNPAKDILTVKAENLSNVTVYNMMGQKIMTQDVDDEELTINTSDFESGIYIVRIVADGNEITKKVSVIK